MQSDVILEERDISVLRQGYMTSRSQPLGWTVKNHIRAKTVILPHMLKTPVLIRKGDTIDLLVVAGAIMVKEKGKALESGAKGTTIRAKNSKTGQIVEGIVMGKGVLQMN